MPEEERMLNAMGILPRFRGMAVHDFWKPYLSFESCRHVFAALTSFGNLEGVRDRERIQWPEAGGSS